MAEHAAERSPLTAVRFKLGGDERAPQPDPLGRTRIGFAPGLSTAELWERGRGVWKAKLTAVAECDLVILAHAGVVVLVGTVDGVSFAGDRIAVTGVPDPSHPLTGRPDPLDNASRNPVAYGDVLTTRPAASQRPYEAVLADAIAVLTEAARLRHSTLRQSEDGKWETHPTRTEQSDWAEFVTLALAGAAANIGSVSGVLAGRPGSWEAAGVESLLDSTVGADGEDLLRHRTEPVRIKTTVAAVLAHFGDNDQYLEAEDELDRQERAEIDAVGELDWDAVYWRYSIPTQGDPLPLSPDAPAWSWDAFRAELARAGHPAERIQQIVQEIRDRTRPDLFPESNIVMSKDAAAEATVAEHEARVHEISDKYEGLRERLTAQRLKDWSAYGAALQERLELATADLTVPVEISIDPVTENYELTLEDETLEWTLLEQAATIS